MWVESSDHVLLKLILISFVSRRQPLAGSGVELHLPI